MESRLPPAEVIEFTTEAYLPTVSVRGQLIYLTTVLAVTAALISLPFIRTEVSVQSPGLVRPRSERNELRPLVAGTLAGVEVRENQAVRVGQPLFRLQTDQIDSKLRLNRVLQAEKRRFIADLERLVRGARPASGSLAGLSSPLYRQQYEHFRFQLAESDETRRKRRRELDLNRKLLADRVIPRQEFEDRAFAFRTAQVQYRALVERQLSEWETALSGHRMSLDELRAQEQQWLKERELYTLRAPVAGSISQLSGKYPGSYVQAGEVLGLISPDSNLMAECSVPPKDIGLLRPGMKVRVQVDAFDYNQWGMTTGTITEISNDIIVPEKQPPYFKVKCRLDRHYLALRDGYRGYLKKGMSLRAHFVVTERSLFDLLYDRADDWLNPKNNPAPGEQ
ncbi:HlyD family secretion protein [Larkinella soli]|uniref:HlyD family secretion protein n=1 Tax=Larkinella soli TaxID=1770527 RepID=UPI000FFBD747|nr:HlyD family efflux transporter periplasmic adaptor subunit [Larkinella soli]